VSFRALRTVQPDAPESRSPPVPSLVRHDPYHATWRERLLVLGSMAALLTTALVLGLYYARKPTLELVGLVPASQFAVGKFLPLWGISGKSSFTPWQLGVVIWVMDTCNVIILVYSLQAFYKLRRFKRALDKIQANASLVLVAYPKLRKAALVGVVAIVLFPVAGTGAYAATFLGILLGMKRTVLIAAVSAGGLLGGMIMATAAVFAYGTVRKLEDPTVQYVAGGVLLVALGVGVYYLNRAYKRALDQARASVGAAEP
jgi:uncharacterized membrane protein